METTQPVENSDFRIPLKDMEPQLELERCLAELRIDHKAKGYTEEKMMETFNNIAENPKAPYHIKEKYKSLVDVLKPHKFWETQPIMNLRKKDAKRGQIQQLNPEEVSKEPMALPQGFSWGNFDVNNDLECDEVCIFLNQHYIEDDDGHVRLYISRDALRYAIQAPGLIADLHFVVRSDKNKRIMAVITGTPKRIQVQGETVKMVEANYLAVHKSLRGKRLAQIMIQELMRRTRLNGLNQGFYTSPDPYPTPFLSVQFMNRLLNVQKLIDVGFVQAPPQKQLAKFKLTMRLPDQKSYAIKGNLRPMEKKDASAVLKLYNKQLERSLVKQKLSQEELLHIMLPREGLIYSYVVENEVDGKVQVTDFWCMKRVTNVVLNKELKHKDIKQAYLLFYGLTVNSYEDMLKQQMY
jgi:glycylpeptide N-tetradecanoyltransferase